MATVSTDQFLDGGTARTAGEAFTVTTGAMLTIRTDTRVHADAPAAMAGSVGSITVTEGECFIDATTVRWMPYNTGSGNVPAIGASITQGGVSGYLLGVWTSTVSAPTALGDAMPATGFIKFREVTGGNFAAGALTGIGASATSPDVAGWIEVVIDDATNITVPRLGKFTTRGDWFYLDETTGVRGQAIQVPTNGGGAGTYAPAAWVETSPGSGVYDHWFSMFDTTNAWSIVNVGEAQGMTDIRQKYFKALGGGQIQFGDNQSVATATYASIAAQASTYVDWNILGTYTWVADKLRINVAAGHNLFGGESVGLDFTSGGGVDQIVTVQADGQYYLVADVPGSGASGNVTVRPGVKVTFTAHGLGEGNQVGATVSTGTLPTGTYTVHSLESNAIYWLTYPHIATVTSGSVSCLHTLQLTRTAHGLVTGRRTYLDFTSGSGVDGVYNIRAHAANTYNVNFPHFAITSGNVTERFDIGYVPPAGCKVRIPNIFARSCATATRAVNSVPNAITTNRPEFTTTSAGDVDLENLYGHWRCSFSNPYRVRMVHCAVTDSLDVGNAASALALEDVVVGNYLWTISNTAALSITACLAGGTVKDITAIRVGASTSYYHALRVTSCAGIAFDGLVFGQTIHTVGTENGFTLTTSFDCTFANMQAIGSEFRMYSSQRILVENYDFNNCFQGITSASNGRSGILVAGGSSEISVDGMTYGFNGAVPDVHVFTHPVYAVSSDKVSFRNIGTVANPLPCGTWEPNFHGTNYLYLSGGGATNIKLQRANIQGCRSQFPFSTFASDYGLLLEHIAISQPSAHVAAATRRLSVASAAGNTETKGVTMVNTLTGVAVLYGTHWQSLFDGNELGDLVVCFNEPTTESAAQFTALSGTPKFNSAGGMILPSVGNKVVFETPHWVLGHTGFVDAAPVMSGGTVGNYRFYYEVNIGSGYSAISAQLTAAELGTELSAVSIPSTGFKLRLTIETTTASNTAITFFTIATTSSELAQTTQLYPLDTNTITFTGLPVGCDAVVLTAGTATIVDQRDALGSTSYGYTFSGAQTIDVGFIKPGYIPFYIRNLALTATNSSIPVSLTADRNYAA